MKNATDGFEMNADYIGRRLYSKPAEKKEASPSFVDCRGLGFDLNCSE